MEEKEVKDEEAAGNTGNKEVEKPVFKNKKMAKMYEGELDDDELAFLIMCGII